jgi:hypothetical protein
MGDPTPQTRAEILKALEERTGRSLRTRDDVRHYVQQLSAENGSRHARLVGAWRSVKHTTLIALLVLALAQYYAIDVLSEIASLSSLIVFVPV